MLIHPEIQNHFHQFGFIINSIKGGSFAAIFLLATLVGYAIPLPEAVILLLFGWAAVVFDLNIVQVFLTGLLGSVLGDNILFQLSLMGHAWAEKFIHKVRKHKLVQYEHLVVSNIAKTIYFLRLIVGVRFFGPVIAGTLGAKWKNFFWADLGATFLNNLLFVLLGYFFYRRIWFVVAEVEIVRNVLFFSSAIIVGFLISFFVSKKKV